MVRRSVPGANEVPALKAHSHDFVTLHRSARWNSSSWSSAIATSALWAEAEVRSYGHVPLSPLATTAAVTPHHSACQANVNASENGHGLCGEQLHRHKHTCSCKPSHPAVPQNLVQVRGWVALLEHAATDLKTELSDDDAQICQELSDWLFVSAVRSGNSIH